MLAVACELRIVGTSVVRLLIIVVADTGAPEMYTYMLVKGSDSYAPGRVYNV